MTSQNAKRGKHAGVDKTREDLYSSDEFVFSRGRVAKPVSEQAASVTADVPEYTPQPTSQPVVPSPEQASESAVEVPRRAPKVAALEPEQVSQDADLKREQALKPATPKKNAGTKSETLTLAERASVFAGKHEGLIGVGLCLFAVAGIALTFWFTVFSGISSSADFLYNQF